MSPGQGRMARSYVTIVFDWKTAAVIAFAYLTWLLIR